MVRDGLAGILLLIVLVAVWIRSRFGKYQWPLTGTITSPFGPRVAPVTGASTNHTGIDISAKVGTPVKAPASGIITNVYSTTSGGKQLVLTHKSGFVSGFAHLSAYTVKSGDAVVDGQVIAYSGNTGITSGPHLHYSLKNQNGEYVNPLDYLS